jgi:hypothetical protein
MDSIKHFKDKLNLLDSMLSRLKSSHAQVAQLRRSVYVLKSLLRDESSVQSPYGPVTIMVPFSRQ